MKNSKCEQIKNSKHEKTTKTQIVTKLRNLKCDNAQKLKI